MAGIRTISVALTDDLVAEIERAIASEDYDTGGEVIREALYLWKQTRDANLARVADLRRAVQQGLDSGEPIDGNFDADDIIRRGRARISELRQLVQEGLDSGEPQPVDDAWFDDIIARGSARLAASKADD